MPCFFFFVLFCYLRRAAIGAQGLYQNTLAQRYITSPSPPGTSGPCTEAHTPVQPDGGHTKTHDTAANGLSTTALTLAVPEQCAGSPRLNRPNCFAAIAPSHPNSETRSPSYTPPPKLPALVRRVIIDQGCRTLDIRVCTCVCICL